MIQGASKIEFAHGIKLSCLCFVSICIALLIACSKQRNTHWQLTDVQGHLPDLHFALTSDQGRSVTAQTYHGYIALVYFGYTHCPDVCPETIARLMQVLEKLGNDARSVRILFISVDPARDTPPKLHRYIAAFDQQHMVGLTGPAHQIEALAKLYRVAYQSEKADADGNYDVTHSTAVYIFDNNGHARLIATGNDSADNIAHDVRLLIRQTA